MASIIQVALALPLNQQFDYLLGPAQEAVVGARYKVPFGSRQLVGICTAIIDDSAGEGRKLKQTLQQIDNSALIDEASMQLCQWACEYYIHPLGEVFHNALPNLLMKGEDARARQKKRWQLSEKGRWLESSQLKRAPKQAALLDFCQQFKTPMAEAFITSSGHSKAAIKGLIDKDILLEAPDAATIDYDNVLAENPIAARDEQKTALREIKQRSDFHTFLLDGKTGSGKTEVYLQAIEAKLKAGLQALVLVPEIGLTPQTTQRFKSRFNVPVVQYHSGLSDRQRLDAWVQIRDQQASILIGTRSAVFAPFAKLGIIIIDEEHDESFKQQDGFRYHARDLAILRAHKEDVPIILGSATPSLESLHNANSKRYTRLVLKQRVNQEKRPVELIDLRSQHQQHGLSNKALEQIKTALEQKQQVMVFLNQRGYAPVLMCHHCGWQAHCKHCDARMTLHLKHNHLRCHHCDWRQAIPKHCKECNSTDLKPVGSGTERLEEFLNEQFTSTPIFRIDRDAVTSGSAISKLLGNIEQQESAILIGTQMLAKGHHFPRLGLVVIAHNDHGWFSPDLRAAEKTAQLITQVAGRVGRGVFQGKILIQTHVPDNPQLNMLLQQGYHAFADEQLAQRSLLQFPPYGYFALIRCESMHKAEAEDLLAQLSLYLQSIEIKSQALGPISAPMARRAGHHRYQLLLKDGLRSQLHNSAMAASHWLYQHPLARKVRWSIDVDPSAMY